MSQVSLERIYTYHPPFGSQQERYERIREAARDFAEVVKSSCPPSREASLAQTFIQQACQMANAAIAINEVAPVLPAVVQEPVQQTAESVTAQESI